jgi:hypothetical protein
VPGLSRERRVHRGERDVSKRVDRARREKDFAEMARKSSTKQNSRRRK